MCHAEGVDLMPIKCLALWHGGLLGGRFESENDYAAIPGHTEKSVLA